MKIFVFMNKGDTSHTSNSYSYRDIIPCLEKLISHNVLFLSVCSEFIFRNDDSSTFLTKSFS